MNTLESIVYLQDHKEDVRFDIIVRDDDGYILTDRETGVARGFSDENDAGLFLLDEFDLLEGFDEE